MFGRSEIMPVQRKLQLDDEGNTPVKRQTKHRNYSPFTGAMSMTPKTKTPAGNYKTSRTTVKALEAPEPQTDTERMDLLRTKFEESLQALMQSRRELVSLLPLEGNRELRSFLLMGSADLGTELKRHKELTSKVNSLVSSTQMHKRRLQGVTQTGSSYEFLKNILSG